MNSDNEKTVILAPSPRKICISWDEISSLKNDLVEFETKRPSESYLALFNLSPVKRNEFYFQIPINETLTIGVCPFLPEGIIIRSIPLLYIDPGHHIGSSCLAVWNGESQGSLKWWGQGIVARIKQTWHEDPAKVGVQDVSCDEIIRGMIGPWFGFIIKGGINRETRRI